MEMLRTETHTITSYAVDAEGKLSLPFLLKLFQDAAYHNAESLGFGYSQMGKSSRFWVLSRLEIQAKRYPRWGDTIILKTWAKTPSRLFALRDFLLTSESGEELIAATTSWLVLDAATRRPLRPQGIFEGVQLLQETHAIEEEAGKVPEFEGAEEAAAFPVRYSDTDVNGHVNNARYIEWILDVYPPAKHASAQVGTVQVNYLAETLCGDRVRLLISGSSVEAGDEQLHSLVRESDGKELCRIRVVWTDGIH